MGEGALQSREVVLGGLGSCLGPALRLDRRMTLAEQSVD